MLEGLKVTTFLALIGASIPVFGFLPKRDFLFLIINEPNDDIFTSCLFSSSDKIKSKIFSIISDEVEFGKPTFEDIFSPNHFLSKF